MSNHNKVDINFEELCNLIALEVGCRATPNTVKKYLKATYKVILQQLQLNNRVYFKKFGAFEIRQRKSGERIIGDPMNGGTQRIFVEPKLSISFKASKEFDYSVNEYDFKTPFKVKKFDKVTKQNSVGKSLVEILNKKGI